MAFLTAENKNRQLEDLPLTDFGRVPGEEKVFNCEFCELKVIPFSNSWIARMRKSEL